MYGNGFGFILRSVKKEIMKIGALVHGKKIHARGHNTSFHYALWHSGHYFSLLYARI